MLKLSRSPRIACQMSGPCWHHSLEPTWAAPLLWRSEFRNVLAFHLHRRLFSVQHALTLAARAEEVIGGRDFAVATDDVLELSLATGCSAYDCEFVALARDLDLPLVTTDREVLRAFPRWAIPPAGLDRL